VLLGHLRAERVVRREGQVWEEHPCGRKIRQAQRREVESVQALTLLCPATLNMNHARGAEKMPFPSYTTTWSSREMPSALHDEDINSAVGIMCGQGDDASQILSMSKNSAPAHHPCVSVNAHGWSLAHMCCDWNLGCGGIQSPPLHPFSHPDCAP